MYGFLERKKEKGKGKKRKEKNSFFKVHSRKLKEYKRPRLFHLRRVFFFYYYGNKCTSFSQSQFPLA